MNNAQLLHERNKFYRQYLKNRNIVCNCGFPHGRLSEDTSHAPDCALELAWIEAMDYFDEENTVFDETH